MKRPRSFRNTIKIIAACTSILLAVSSCKTKQPTVIQNDGEVTFKFVQLNDVYEIASLGGNGGMARVAWVYDSIKAKEPNTYMFMAGDFLNPSLLGTLRYQGERIRGKQMIEVMNAMNFELVTFGNHEFDIGEEALQKRMDESNFYWTSANVFQNNDDGPRSFFFRRNNDSIYVPETYTIPIEGADGEKIDVGLFSVTLPSNPQDFVYYADIELEARSAYTKLQMQQAEVIVGLTHLEKDQDVALANAFPEIALIMGGHEHANMLVPTNNGMVAKADANAKSIYVHTFTYNTKTNETQIESKLLPIDERIPENGVVKQIVDKWSQILNAKIKEVTDRPNEVIFTANIPLDGTDGSSRGVQTNLGKIISRSMAYAFQDEVDGALVNGGSIRIDDMLSGEVSALDIFRVLPFGGGVLKVEMKGALLKEVLDYGKEKGGTGAYLQRYNFNENAKGGWSHQNTPLEDEKIYKVAVSDFLMKGFDIPFLTPENEGVVSVYKPLTGEVAFDIRKAIILYLKSIK